MVLATAIMGLRDWFRLAVRWCGHAQGLGEGAGLAPVEKGGGRRFT